MATAIFLSGSRMGLLLLVLSSIGGALLVMARGTSRKTGKIRLAVPAVLAVGGLGAVAYAARIPALVDVLSRFSQSAGGRTSQIWPDAVWLAGQAWPFGTGLGTFPHVFGLAERLAVVDTTYANRAHNDWLEFVIEAGLPGLVVLLGMGAILFVSMVRKWRGMWDPADSWAAFALFVIGLHSLVDYPLRAIAMSIVAGIAAGLLLANKSDKVASDEI
nr:O-antigen ligase family protein [Qipengyuania sphaerica]